jgi:hypothetical protein
MRPWWDPMLPRLQFFDRNQYCKYCANSGDFVLKLTDKFEKEHYSFVFRRLCDEPVTGILILE